MRWMSRGWISWMLICSIAGLAGCAIKGAVTLVQAEQTYATATQTPAPEAKSSRYAWAMAESYMLKAREEYAYADYEVAARYATLAQEWAVKAQQMAQADPTPYVPRPELKALLEKAAAEAPQQAAPQPATPQETP